MTEWNHRICERCWFDGSAERLEKRGKDQWELVKQGEPLGIIKEGKHKGAYRMPVQSTEAEPGVCCFCGGMTITGIFTRIHQDEVLCKGRHEPDQLGDWSRVGV